MATTRSGALMPAHRPLPALCAALALAACTPDPGDTAPPGDSTPGHDTGDTTPQPDACDPDGDHIDQGSLDAALAWIDDNPNHIDSFAVAHCGQTLVATTYNGYEPATLHDLQSATKSYSAVLVGIAIDQGLISGVDQPIAELLPDHAHLLEGDKALITVEHLLTMSSGLAWTDFGPGNSFDRIAAAEDSVAFILGEPLETTPGEVFFYNTGSSHLLSAIVHNNSGMSTAAYAEQQLFEPQDITAYTWPTTLDGIAQGGWGMTMTPGDFAKLGQLLLDEGRQDDAQLVSQAFVDAATAPQVDNGMGGSYGYQLWIETNLFEVEDLAAARGYGGQDCFVLEELDMVVTFTGDIRYPADMAQDVVTLMNDFVLPAHAEGAH
jgi:CubicO group peptidase (beta-lactamase class C family)